MQFSDFGIFCSGCVSKSLKSNVNDIGLHRASKDATLVAKRYFFRTASCASEVEGERRGDPLRTVAEQMPAFSGGSAGIFFAYHYDKVTRFSVALTRTFC